MQIKLLTLALFASFFATGFTATVYPGLTEAESATIEPLVQFMGHSDLTKDEAGCIAKVVKGYMYLPLNGTPLFPNIADKLEPDWEQLYQSCLDDPNDFE